MTSSDSHPFGSNDAKSPDVDLLPPSFRGSDSADAQGIDLKSSSRLYHIYHTAIRYDYRVLDADKNHLYFVYNSLWTPIKEDITVHAGEYNHAPVAGSMVWEDLQCQNLTMTKYRWQLSIPSTDGGYDRRSFLWKRTQSVGADGDSPSFFSLRNFKLVDELNGQVVAVFTSNNFKSVRKNGKLQVVAEYGPQFDIMALITLLAMYERIRRRTRNKGGGGGGG